MKISDAEISSLLFDEQASDPATPAAGFWRAYFKAGGWYVIDDAGAVTAFTSAADLAAHLADAADAHDASAISYAGGTGMSATDVEAAIDELATEKANLAGATFTGDIVVPDEAYNATDWNGSLEVPTKNAVRDKIETLGAGGGVAAGGVGGPPLIIRKTADESLTSSTALQDDNELFTAIGASEVWVAEWTLYVAGATSPGDFDPAINLPAGATMRWAAMGLAVSATSGEFDVKINSSTTVNSAAAGTFGTIGTSPATMVTIRATIVNSTNAGNIQLRWAQGSSSGTATTVLAGSILKAYRLA